MPTYDYRCEANQNIYEVNHAMTTRLTTWAELCKQTGIGLGDIAPDSPVTKLISGPGVVKSSSLKTPDAPPCMTGRGCSGGGCDV